MPIGDNLIGQWDVNTRGRSDDDFYDHVNAQVETSRNGPGTETGDGNQTGLSYNGTNQDTPLTVPSAIDPDTFYNTAFTIAVRARFPAPGASGFRSVFGGFSSTVGSRRVAISRGSDGTADFAFVGGGNVFMGAVPPDLRDGDEHVIVVRRNTPSGPPYFEMFVDGSANATSGLNPAGATATNELVIASRGSNTDTFLGFFDGGVFWAAVWDRALTNAEITTELQAQPNPFLPAGPALSAPTLTAATINSMTGTVATDTGDGALWAVLTGSPTTPSVAQIKAGQDDTGSSAESAVANQAISATGTQNVTFASVSANQDFWAHYVQTDAQARDSQPVSTTAQQSIITIPNPAVTFTPATDEEPSSVTTSNSATVQGINVPVPVSSSIQSGAGGAPQFSVNGDAFSNTTRNIIVGQTLQLRHTTPSPFGSVTVQRALFNGGDAQADFQSTVRSANAPVLSDPTAVATGTSTMTLGVTSNAQGDGNVWFVLDANATEPSAAQIIAGQNAAGQPALRSGNQVAELLNSFAILGLASNTRYYAWYTQNGAEGNASVVGADDQTASASPGYTEQPTLNGAPGSNRVDFTATATDNNPQAEPLEHRAFVYTQASPPADDDAAWAGTGAVTGLSGDGARTSIPSGQRQFWGITGLDPSTAYLVAYTVQNTSTQRARATDLTFSTAASAPTITSINSGQPVLNNQQNVSIVGSNFGATQGAGFVRYSNEDLSVVSWSDTSIVVNWLDVAVDGGTIRLGESNVTVRVQRDDGLQAQGSTATVADTASELFGLITSDALGDPSIFSNDTWPAGQGEAYGRFTGGIPDGPVGTPGFTNSFERGSDGRLNGRILGLQRGSSLEYRIYDIQLSQWSNASIETFAPTDDQVIESINGNDLIINLQNPNFATGQSLGGATGLTLADSSKRRPGTDLITTATQVTFTLADVKSGGAINHLRYGTNLTVEIQGNNTFTDEMYVEFEWLGQPARVLLIHYTPGFDDVWDEHYDAQIDINDDPSPEILLDNIDVNEAPWNTIPEVQAFPVQRGGIELRPPAANTYVDMGVTIDPSPQFPDVAIPNITANDQVEFVRNSSGGFGVTVFPNGTLRVNTAGNLTTQTVTLWRYDSATETWSTNDVSYTEPAPTLSGGGVTQGETTVTAGGIVTNKPRGTMHGVVYARATTAPTHAQVRDKNTGNEVGSNNAVQANAYPLLSDLPTQTGLVASTQYSYYVTFEDEAGTLPSSPAAPLRYDFTTDAPPVQPPAFSGNINDFTAAQGDQNVFYDFRPFFTTGGNVDSYALTGTLPQDLIFNAAGFVTGNVSATATPGTVTGYLVTATNTAGTAQSNPFSITVQEVITTQPPVWSAIPDQSGNEGDAIAFSLDNFIVGGDPVVTYGIVSGTLPPSGLLNTSSGAVTGNYTQPGSFGPITFFAENAGGRTEQTMTAWTVTAAAVAPVWSTIPNWVVQEGQPGSVDLNLYVTGTQPITFVSSGAALPTGVTLDGATGILSGDGSTPAGVYPNLEFEATNAAASGVKSNTFSLNVVAVGPTPEGGQGGYGPHLGIGIGLPLSLG